MEFDFDPKDDESMKEVSENSSYDAELEGIENTNEVVVQPPAELSLPIGIEEKPEDLIFIDPSSGEGKRILSDPETDVSELFALLRQFVTPVCNNVGLIVGEMLDRSLGVNDIDITSGMTILHYVIRAECICTDNRALIEALRKTLLHGADMSQRTMLTDMNAFHIAAFFDCPESLEVLINEAGSEDDVDYLINSLCSEYDYGSPLHLAAANLSVNAAEVLLKYGADKLLADDMGRVPEYCIPRRIGVKEDKRKAERLKEILSIRNEFEPKAVKYVESVQTVDTSKGERPIRSQKYDIANKETSKLGFSIGDIVVIGGSKRGTVRFVGQTKFAPGIWCGVELDDAVGKNDGSINGVRYFTCERSRGVFTPASKVVRVAGSPSDKFKQKPNGYREPTPRMSYANSLKSNLKKTRLKVGMTVRIDHLKAEGKIRYLGETDFAPGIWVGLSLGRPLGKNNGTVRGREYFKCKHGHGIMLRPARVSVGGIGGDNLL